MTDLKDGLLSWVQQMLNGSADQQPTSASLMKAGALLDLQNTVVIYTVEDALACAKNKTLHEVSDCLRSSLWSWVQQMLNGSADQQPSLMKAGALLDLQNTVQNISCTNLRLHGKSQLKFMASIISSRLLLYRPKYNIV